MKVLFAICVVLLAVSSLARTTSLDVQNWRFYQVSTAQLDDEMPKQQTIALSSLMSLEPVECRYEDLRAAVLSVIEKGNGTHQGR